jgi:hypothetical protein
LRRGLFKKTAFIDGGGNQMIMKVEDLQKDFYHYCQWVGQPAVNKRRASPN